MNWLSGLPAVEHSAPPRNDMAVIVKCEEIAKAVEFGEGNKGVQSGGRKRRAEACGGVTGGM